MSRPFFPYGFCFFGQLAPMKLRVQQFYPCTFWMRSPQMDDKNDKMVDLFGLFLVSELE